MYRVSKSCAEHLTSLPALWQGKAYGEVSCATHCLDYCQAWCLSGDDGGCLGTCTDECVPACLTSGERPAAGGAEVAKEVEEAAEAAGLEASMLLDERV